MDPILTWWANNVVYFADLNTMSNSIYMDNSRKFTVRLRSRPSKNIEFHLSANQNVEEHIIKKLYKEYNNDTTRS